MNGTALQLAERPLRQLAHSPQEIWNGTLTSVPGGVATPALSPASSTSATHSCPSGNGAGKGEWPWTIIASSRSNGRASRAAFIDATAVLLRRQGYAATGLSEIVERSGAPRGSVYFHFPGGKEELAVAAMARSGEQLRGAIAAL